MSNWECPQCHRDDMVQKASAIIRSGSSEGIGATVGQVGDQSVRAVSSSSSTTVLAGQLAADKPTKPSDPWLVMQRLIVAIPLALGIGGCGVLFAVADKGESPLTLFGFVLPAVAAWMLYMSYKLWLRRDELDAALLKTHSEKMARWVIEAKTLEARYYCHRCDKVFIPEETESL